MSTQGLATALLSNHVCDNCDNQTYLMYSDSDIGYWESMSNNPIARCSLKLKQGTNKYKTCPRVNTCKKWSPIIER